MTHNKSRLTPSQLIACEKVRAKHNKAARIIPLLKVFSLFICAILFLNIAFEIAIFSGVASYINDGKENSLSTTMLVFTGVIALIALHIVTIRYKESLTLKIIDTIVLVLLPCWLLGFGFIYSSELSESLISMLSSSDPEAETPPLPEFMQNVILPNSFVLASLGVCGLTSFAIFSSSHLFHALTPNIEKITRLDANSKAANQYMPEIARLQTRYLISFEDYKNKKEQFNDLAENNANKIVLEINRAVNILDGWIVEKELNPDIEVGQDDLEVLFNEDTPEAKAIRGMPLSVLKTYRDDLKKWDKKSILAVIQS